MLEQRKRISFRISSVLCKVEPEPAAGADPLHRLRIRPKSTGSATLLTVCHMLAIAAAAGHHEPWQRANPHQLLYYSCLQQWPTQLEDGLQFYKAGSGYASRSASGSGSILRKNNRIRIRKKLMQIHNPAYRYISRYRKPSTVLECLRYPVPTVAQDLSTMFVLVVI